MFPQRSGVCWFDSVSENKIWKDRVRRENEARKNYDQWQPLYNEYKQLYSFCKNKTTSCASVQRSRDFHKISANVTRRHRPETTAREVGHRLNYGCKLEKFGANIRGLKTKRDIYKTFNWPEK